MKILHLHLKGEYFDAIKRGEKAEEFREVNETWIKQLGFPEPKPFDEVHLYRGYPKRGDRSRILKRKYRGYVVKKIEHEHFGTEPVWVFAIDVTVLRTRVAFCAICEKEHALDVLSVSSWVQDGKRVRCTDYKCRAAGETFTHLRGDHV